jgi:hypothetical protein
MQEHRLDSLVLAEVTEQAERGPLCSKARLMGLANARLRHENAPVSVGSNSSIRTHILKKNKPYGGIICTPNQMHV